MSTKTTLRYSLVAAYLKRGKSGIREMLFSKEDLQETNASVRLGNVIETLLWFSDVFDVKYIVFDNIPSESIKLIINTMFDNKMEWTDENILFMAKAMNYYKGKRSDEKILEAFKPYEDYYIFLKNKGTKTCISQEEYNKAKYCVDGLLNSAKTRKYLKLDDKKKVLLQEDLSGILTFNNKPYRFSLHPDSVVIDEEKKEIQIIDLKTGFRHPEEFNITIREFYYFIQAIIYNKYFQTYFPNYTIKPFKFVYSCTELSNYPIVWEIANEELDNIINEIKLDEILDEIIYSIEEGNYTVSKNYIDRDIYEYKYTS